MNKNQFLQIIKDGLNDFPKQELDDIIYDYQEHFYSAMEAGKSEEEIVNELGDPYVIVNGYRAGYMQKVQEEKEETAQEEPFREERRENTSYTNYEGNNRKSNDANKILKIVIVALVILLVGPVVFGVGMGVLGALFGIIVALIAVPFSLTVAGCGVLFSALFNHTLGFISVPPFIADFPMSVIVLMTVGSFALSILSLMLAYYLIKWIIVLIRRLIVKYNNRGVA